MDSGLITTKDYEIKNLELIASNGETIDLRKVFLELQIYQDLYASVMSGEIYINDGNDLFNNFNFCGNEYLRLNIDKGGLGLPIQKIFRVYKATDRTPAKNSSQVYALHFCSDEMMLSNSMKVSKSYKGQSVSDIVWDVMTNILKISSEKINSFETTSGTYDFVVPYYRPLEVIQWATARAYDVQPKFCYFFYENSFGFNFQSLQGLYKQKPYKTMTFDIKQINPDPSDNRDSIDKFKILNDYDAMMSVSNGSFASRILAVDVFNQTYRNYDYSLDIAESQKNLLNAAKPVNMPKNASGNTNMESYESYFTTYIQINDTSSERENSIEKWMQPRALHLAAINAFRFQAVLPGDIAMKAGDIVEFKFPKFVAPDDKGKEYDELRSGKYLVTAVNHKFREDVFETIAEFSSDSYASRLPDAKDLTSILQKKN